MSDASAANPERDRLAEDERREKNWKRWGPYLAERQWGTVREDYSSNGDAWAHFPHDHARSRAYRWGEDGLLGFTDRECRLCFGLALWNGEDPILKERLFGLNGPEGNHGEDVKELYYYLDATPTHSYCKSLYKYPQREFPYAWLVDENRRRGLHDDEFEILDTDAFNENRYFDIFAEYAKAGPNDMCVRITVHNRAEEGATLHLLPSFWYRNTWAWGCEHEGCFPKPHMAMAGERTLVMDHDSLGRFYAWYEDAPDILFTDNETNTAKLYGASEGPAFAKDGFHDYVIDGRYDAVNEKQSGTKAAAHYRLYVPSGESQSFRLRFAHEDEVPDEPFDDFDEVFEERIAEADAFYSDITRDNGSADDLQVLRQAYAGLLQSKQFYHYSVDHWMEGDPAQLPPPPGRGGVRNGDWRHLFTYDILSMPDKWEYPWFAAWDTAFHMVPFDKIDPHFAKEQLILFLREWYLHPNGQLPAYEWNFSDVNPPVHAWSVWRIYKMTGKRGERDRDFLAQCFHKLLLNFTWWVNRKDPNGNNVFGGGFLGLDNIGAFDRSKTLPGGARLEQADGTAWMGFFCATMLSIALELAAEDPSYEGIASKFFEHFVAIAHAINHMGGDGLWDEEDGFYYDELLINGHVQRMKIRSMVGLLPLCAVEILKGDVIDRLPRFKKRMQWFFRYSEVFTRGLSSLDISGGDDQRTKMLLALPSRERLERIFRYLFDENEFLSPYGIRSLSKAHEQQPYVLDLQNERHVVGYEPNESRSHLFGGNSNWRGPVWFPVNFLLIEALQRYHYYFGESFKVEVPTGSGKWVTLDHAAQEIAQRLVRLFEPDEHGDRPVNRQHAAWYRDKHFRDLVLFYEYFDGDNGRGCGASHQTGWTGLIAKILEDRCRYGG